MGNSIRTFIAFKLPADVVRLATDLQTELKRQGLRLRWVRPGNIHLTLKFLGDIPPCQAADVAAGMRIAAQNARPPALTVQGMGIFPNLKRPRVLWVGMGGQTDLLRQVHENLEAQLALLGFDREHRPYKAHLTLARINHPTDPGRLLQSIQGAGQFAPMPFQAAELVLLQSELRPRGAIYTPLARARLGQG